jgi:hypothetical protein
MWSCNEIDIILLSRSVWVCGMVRILLVLCACKWRLYDYNYGCSYVRQYFPIGGSRSQEVTAFATSLHIAMYFFPVDAIAASSIKKEIRGTVLLFDHVLSCKKKAYFPWWIHLIIFHETWKVWQIRNVCRFVKMNCNKVTFLDLLCQLLTNVICHLTNSFGHCVVW